MLGAENVQKLTYGSGVSRRFTQDSPVLPDVWARFAEEPNKPVDQLLTPYQHSRSKSGTPGEVRDELEGRLKDARNAGKAGQRRGKDRQRPFVAVNQTTVATWLHFDQLVRVVLPMSAWWSAESRHRKKSKRPSLATVIRKLQVKKTREAVSRALAEDQANTELGLSPDLIWLFKVVGAIALLKNPRDSSDGKSPWMQEAGDPQASQAELTAYYLHVAEALRDVTKGVDARPLQDSLVHLVSQNRRARMALFSSVAATKSDAARRLFEIDGSGITWAVIDSGIDARHPAFRNIKNHQVGKGPANHTAKKWGLERSDTNQCNL